MHHSDLTRSEVKQDLGGIPRNVITTPLEVLLTERIVSAWLFVEVQEALLNAQLKRDSEIKRCPPSYLKFMIGWLDSAHRRYLAAIKSLAQVRRLQSTTPGVQFNTQINVSSKAR